MIVAGDRIVGSNEVLRFLVYFAIMFRTMGELWIAELRVVVVPESAIEGCQQRLGENCEGRGQVLGHVEIRRIV